MKISQGVEWGLHCATLLALAPPDRVVRRDRLAAHYGLPEAYLAKHLQAMARAGVLHAVPGPRGGYRLGREAARITVLDVVEAVEGSTPPFLCQEIRQRGTGALPPDQCRRPCAIHATMTAADQAWRASLRTVTIADLVARLPAGVRERNEKIVS
ncbi:RrF2 family transcriptional regulator [Actinocatenispora rupis]|uniref:Rrf2 family transcriptional regulator n=1 Tax=Actinocatenispora rupis TaxID=519421 RepID=A0A8J3JH37_9ACTN|nr:Rrf2 family transcriptional regulator [Actinocatenispora rupis]GID14793.1 Rrf2 family transcriptional regulator [Actinocatenispora rupis]